MSSCSSCSSSSAQHSIQQLLKQATSPLPKQDDKTPSLTKADNKPGTLNADGDRGTKVNVST